MKRKTVERPITKHRLNLNKYSFVKVILVTLKTNW